MYLFIIYLFIYFIYLLSYLFIYIAAALLIAH